MTDNFYEFNPEDAYRFAKAVGIPYFQKGKELNFKYCPYCQGGRKKDKNTFSISLKTGMYKCMRGSCAVKGNMLTLAKDFDFTLSEDVSRYINQNNYNNRFKQFRDAHRVIESKSTAIEYLKGRGISEGICRLYEVTGHKEQDNVIVFPFKDGNGELRFIKYRNIAYKKGDNGSKEWCERNCMPILFGMSQCSPEIDTLIITEGQIDSLSVAECGYKNAVSVPTGKNGFTWVPHCWDWLHRFKTVVVFGDYEKGEMSLLPEIRQKFRFLQVKAVRFQDYKDCKDANEILRKYGKKQIQTCIDNAEAIIPKTLVDITEVEDIDFSLIPRISTGVEVIDKRLGGGIPFGGVTIISGKAGEGKSTFASQILTRAIEARYKCLAYSGELPNAMFKNWIYLQLAGDHVVKSDTGRFILKNADRDKISEILRGQLYLYDASSGITEGETLCKVVEQAVIQYGIKVVLLDNLMTAMDIDGNKDDTLYNKQSIFMKQIAGIALRNDVLIILVAHKNKSGFDGNDAISGSSDIANLSTVIISYEKQRANENGDRLIKITKERLAGHTDFNGIATYFDEKSKRIYGADEDLEFVSRAFSDSDGFHEATEEIPF